jgi:MFS superfamily sulfate permease-like transporter
MKKTLSSKKIIPKTGVKGLKENWRSDLLAGFAVFLTALPLCLAIALASGFPPASGIITALIGGLLISRINGSFVTINGPAAGLIVVIFAAVQTLGEGDVIAGYRYTLAAIVFASALQILMGWSKVGRLSAFFPLAVVHGMLAAIGIIIIAKQFHVMLGVIPEEGNIFSIIGQIPESLFNPTPKIAAIGLSGLAVIIFWPIIRPKKLKPIPLSLIVLFIGMLLAQVFGLQHEHIHFNFSAIEAHQHMVEPQFLVKLPDYFFSNFYYPDFSKTFTWHFWAAVMSICLVGSLETLLSTAAIDKLDPYKRKSNLNRDLTAIGFGNMIAGFIGGLPMVAEIIRSTTNVNNGGRTGWANFFHALILLIFVVVFPHFIHNIPLASLAVLLIYTGYRLASPQSFRKVLHVGREQLIIFCITILAVLSTDLLIGVSLGIIAKLGFHLSKGVWLSNLFKIYFTLHRPDEQTIVIKLQGSALFSNFLRLRRTLSELETGKRLVFNFTDGYLIDHTVMDYLENFRVSYQANGGRCYQIGEPLKTFSDHKLAARIMTKDDRFS